MSFLRHLWNGLSLVVLTVIFSLAAMVVVPFTRRGRVITAVARGWARSVLFMTRVRVEVCGTFGPFPEPAYLVMANHTSHFDVIAVYAVLPIDMRPVAKRELGYIPIFGWVLRMGAAIMVDRGDRGRAIASIERAGAAIRGGRSVLLFPEGTRTPPGVLGPLKKGPFYLAASARVPVVPVALTGAGEVMRVGDWRIHPRTIRLRVGSPIPTDRLPEGEPGREALSREVEAALRRLLAEDAATPGQVA